MNLKKFVALATCAIASHAGAADTIKIGLLTVDSGPFTFIMRHVTEPTALAVELFNAQGGALGRKYEIVAQTYAGPPAAAAAAVNRLVKQEGVSFLTGFNTSSSALVLGPQLASLNALLIDSSTAADELTGKNCQANYFRVSMTDSMNMNALRAVAKQSGAKTWDLLMPDYATGHDFAKRFTSLVQAQGGTVQATLFAPMATTDFGSYITQLSTKPADALAIVFPGSTGVMLSKQQAQFGLFSKYKTVVSAFFTNDMVIDAQGDSTVGVYAALGYKWEMPGEHNAAFVKAFEEHFKRKPTYLDADAYQSMELLNAAILKARSTDVAAVRAALSGLKMTTVVGDVEMRAADHQLLRPIALVQVTKAGEGKGAITLRSVEPIARIADPASPECRL
ncbi:MAG TPA: ABC transporter substrate-binding protein [Burkholderiaceae bacterium]|jgi:branched-chain amino acid transport system substrate-binding protein